MRLNGRTHRLHLSPGTSFTLSGFSYGVRVHLQPETYARPSGRVGHGYSRHPRHRRRPLQGQWTVPRADGIGVCVCGPIGSRHCGSSIASRGGPDTRSAAAGRGTVSATGNSERPASSGCESGSRQPSSTSPFDRFDPCQRRRFQPGFVPGGHELDTVLRPAPG